MCRIWIIGPTFTAGGSFKPPDVAGTTGTWSCPGNKFVEVNCAFGGFETQQWLAEANPAMKGHGKSVSGGYLYSLAACLAEKGGGSCLKPLR